MDPQNSFQELLRLIAPVMKERGFTRTGPTFYLRREDNWGIVNFQKSKSSSAEQVKFTVNVATVSGALRRLFPASWHTPRPTESHGQWRERIGFLLPDRHDKWWTIDQRTSLEKLAEEFRGHLTRVVIPAVESYVRDEALRDYWLEGRASGLTEDQRLAYLAVLLKLLGPRELLAPVIKKMERQQPSDVLDQSREVLAGLGEVDP